MAKKQLEDRNFYNAVRERERLVSMLFGSHGKRTETTTSNILKVSLLGDQVRSNRYYTKLTIQTASQVFESKYFSFFVIALVFSSTDLAEIT